MILKTNGENSKKGEIKNMNKDGLRKEIKNAVSEVLEVKVTNPQSVKLLTALEQIIFDALKQEDTVTFAGAEFFTKEQSAKKGEIKGVKFDNPAKTVARVRAMSGLKDLM